MDQCITSLSIMIHTIGSVTLLKWKLLATPQLGGATSYFSNLIHPGVHMKSWKGISPKHSSHKTSSQDNTTNITTAEEELGSSVDCSPSSSINTKGKVYSRTKTNTSTCSVSGMNDITGLLLDSNSNNNNSEEVFGVVNSDVVPSKSSDTLPHHSKVGMSR